MINATAATTLINDGSAAGLTFGNVGSAATNVTVQNTSAATTVAYTTTTGTQAINLNLSNVTGAADVTIAGVETVSVTSSGSANSVDLELSAATTLNFSGNQNLTVADLATDGTTIKVSNVDASAMTGNLTISLGNQAGVAAGTNVSVTGGSGNDSLTVTGVTQNVSVVGGAGNDTIISTTLDTSDTIDGGIGTDTLSSESDDMVALAASTPTTYKITNIEALTISNQFDDGGAALTVRNVATTVNTLNLQNDAAATLTAGAESVVGGAGSFTVNFGKTGSTNSSTGLANAFTVSDTGTAITDTLNLVNTFTLTSNGTSADMLADRDITANGYETVNISTGGATQNITTLTITPDDLNIGVSLVATGGGGLNIDNLTTGARGLLSVDASGLSAQPNNGNTLVVEITGQGVGGTTNVVGSAGKDVIVQTAAFQATIDGGAGNDDITGGSLADSLKGGSGNDTILSGGGNDVIYGNEGVDSLTLNGTGVTALLDGGAGNDTLTVGNNLAKTQTLIGGEGVDALSLSDTSLANWSGYTTDEKAALKANINAIETLQVSNTTSRSIDVSTLVNTAQVNKVQFDAAATGGSFTKLASGTTVEYRAGGNTQTLSVAGSGSADVLTIALNANAASTTTFGTITTTGIETVNINSTTRQDTKSSATNTVTVSNADLISSTITGASNTVVTYAAATDIETIDGSATTGTLNITATAATVGTTITAGTGSMTVASGSGGDSIVGGAGNDSIESNTGADTIFAGAGDDTIDGGAATDVIDAGANDDTIITSSGADTIDGGTGTDTLSVATLYRNLTTMSLSNMENLDLNSNQVTLTIAQYNDFDTFADVSGGVKFSNAGTVVANTVNLASYTLANGVNTFTANGELAYVVTGAAATSAAQTFNFAGQYLTNDDSITGGGGTSDYLYVTGNQAVNTTGTATSSNIGAVEYIVFDNTNTNITLVAFDAVATSGALTIDATAQASGNTSITTADADVDQSYNILLSAGTNLIDARTIDADSTLTVVGGVGNDEIRLDDGDSADYLDLSAGGIDTVTGIGGTDVLITGVSGDTVSVTILGDFTAGSGTSNSGAAVTFTASTAADAISLANASITGSVGYTINGLASTASTITGSAGADSISGGSAIDSIVGGAGADTISGGGGNDVITGGTGADRITIGTSTLATVVYTASGESRTGTFTSGASTAAADVYTGLEIDDVIDLYSAATLSTGSTTAGTTGLSATTAGGVALVTGLYDATAGTFTIAAASITNDDLMIQWADGTAINTIILNGDYFASATTVQLVGNATTDNLTLTAV